MWRTKEQEDRDVLIARIEGDVVTKSFPAVMATFGAIAMVIAVLAEESAVRLAAWGATWTGWNLLCIMGVLRQTRTDYLVYRVVLDQRDQR
jgi:hypothetical protein